MRSIYTVAPILVFLCSCSSFQDVGLLRYQLESGADPVHVERGLLELSSDGYIEADTALAGLYFRKNSIDSLRQACNIYERQKTYSTRSQYRYARCLARLSYLDPSARDAAHQALRIAAESGEEILPELARYYTFHSAHYDQGELWRIIDRMDDDSLGRQLSLRVIQQSEKPELFRGRVDEICGDASDELTVSRCEQIRLKIAKTENNEEELNRILETLHERYSDAGEKGLSEIGESTLYNCSRILLSEEIGSKHLLAALNLASLGRSVSDRLFLLCARSEYKDKLLMGTEELLEGLTALDEKGNLDATLLLGRMYAKGFRVLGQPELAERYLRKTLDNPKGALYLGRLYLSGKLGAEKLQDGIETLLSAARRGEFLAYVDLARAFNGFPGIKTNPGYVWVFATMGAVNIDNQEKAIELQKLAQQVQQSIPDRDLPRKLLALESQKVEKAACLTAPSETLL